MESGVLDGTPSPARALAPKKRPNPQYCNRGKLKELEEQRAIHEDSKRNMEVQYDYR